MVELGGAGYDDDFFETVLVMISHGRVKRAGLPRTASASCDDTKRDRRQMFKSTLFVDHFATLRWHDDGFLSLHLNK